MFLNVLLILAGLAILIKGADLLVEGGSSLARRMRVSELTIGLTIVAFGTSMPELTVNVINSTAGRNEAVLGNVIGSNIFNLLFILGVAGLMYPLTVQRTSVRYEVPLSMIAAIAVWLLANDGRIHGASENQISRSDSLILLSGFIFFLYYIIRTMRPDITTKGEDVGKVLNKWLSVGMVLLGVGLLVGGGYLVTENAVALAEQLGLSEKLIGLTILAIGTSLPELSTSVVAAYRKNTDIAIGNVIGSNILNIFFVTGVSVLIHPISYPIVLNEDLMVLIGGSALLLVFMFTLGRSKLDRWEAAVFLVAYLAYTVYLIIRN